MLVDSPTSAGLDQPSCDHSIEPSNNHAQHNERARDNAHALTFSAIEEVIEVGVDDSAAVVHSETGREASFLLNNEQQIYRTFSSIPIER